MNKLAIVKQIQALMQQELQTLLRAVDSAREAATHEESRAEDHHDTRGLEASYLAGAQAQRAAELQQQIAFYSFLQLRNFGPQEEIGPSALVELELQGRRLRYFLAPQGGGMSLEFEGVPLQVITPQSPMGEELMGRRAGECIELEGRDRVREYRIISVA